MAWSKTHYSQEAYGQPVTQSCFPARAQFWTNNEKDLIMREISSILNTNILDTWSSTMRVEQVGNVQDKLLCILDWIMIKDDDKEGHWINMALVLSFGIISIVISIFSLFSTVFVAADGLSIMELLSRIILAVIFLPIGLGSILFLRRSFRNNEEEIFWGDLKDMSACLQTEENLSSSDILEIKQLIGTEAQKENT